MSLRKCVLAIVLAGAASLGCDVEDDEKEIPATPAPAEPTRPVPQPQVEDGGRTRALAAVADGGPVRRLL